MGQGDGCGCSAPAPFPWPDAKLISSAGADSAKPSFTSLARPARSSIAGLPGSARASIIPVSLIKYPTTALRRFSPIPSENPYSCTTLLPLPSDYSRSPASRTRICSTSTSTVAVVRHCVRPSILSFTLVLAPPAVVCSGFGPARPIQRCSPEEKSLSSPPFPLSPVRLLCLFMAAVPLTPTGGTWRPID